MQADAVIDKVARGSPSFSWEDNASLAAECERLKEELELVSYVASHDLQAPLRSILDSCKGLDASPGFIENNEKQPTFQKIAQEAMHMKLLIDGLLDYLRLETFSPSHATLDVNEIVEGALLLLNEKIRETGAIVTYDRLPTIYGHRGRLTRLFTHLLDNALKFRGQQPTQIHISVHPINNAMEFCIADNGIGLDEEYHTIIFTLFQRLPTAKKYPGEGIGLALSRKIVESHGGKLWVVSAPAKGSRFYFTLPTPDGSGTDKTL